MTIRVHIEEVVLHGFDRASGTGLAQGLQRELARLLTERPGELRSADRLDAGSIHLRSPARPGAAGADVAQAVHGALTRRNP